MDNGRSHNERFAKIAGVVPLKRHHELATASPASISVRPATSASRLSVARNGGEATVGKATKIGKIK
jgi:hypothetical protein